MKAKEDPIESILRQLKKAEADLCIARAKVNSLVRFRNMLLGRMAED